MAKVNRYYNPVRTNYVSQYIPQQLPTDLLLAGLQNKEKAFDEAMKQAEAYRTFDFNALPGEDVKYRDAKKKEVESILDKIGTEIDPTSSEGKRMYTDLVRSIRDDKTKTKIEAEYDKHQKFLENRAKLRAAGKWSAAQEAEYQKVYGRYTSEGAGYLGPYSIADPEIEQGNDFKEWGSKVFGDLKDSGSDVVKLLGQENIHYKNDWKGVTMKGDIIPTLDKIFANEYTSAEGRELQRQYDMNNDLDSYDKQNMTAEEKKQYEADKKDYVYNTLLGYGREFIHGVSSTNKDEALNKASDRRAEAAAVEQSVAYTGTVEGNIGSDFKSDEANFRAADTNIKQINSKINKLDEIEKILSSGRGTTVATSKELRDLYAQIDPEAAASGRLTPTPEVMEKLRNIRESYKNQKYNNEYNQSQISNTANLASQDLIDRYGVKTRVPYSQAISDLKNNYPKNNYVGKNSVEFTANSLLQSGSKSDEDINKAVNKLHKDLANRGIKADINELKNNFTIYLNAQDAKLGFTQALEKSSSKMKDEGKSIDSEFNELYKQNGSKAVSFRAAKIGETYNPTVSQYGEDGVEIDSFTSKSKVPTADQSLQNFIRNSGGEFLTTDGKRIRFNEDIDLRGIGDKRDPDGSLIVQVEVPHFEDVEKDGKITRVKVPGKGNVRTIKISGTNVDNIYASESASDLKTMNAPNEKGAKPFVMVQRNGKDIPLINQSYTSSVDLTQDQKNLYVKHNKNINSELYREFNNIIEKKGKEIDKVTSGTITHRGKPANLTINPTATGFNYTLEYPPTKKSPNGIKVRLDAPTMDDVLMDLMEMENNYRVHGK